MSELEAKISENGKKPLPPLVQVPRILVEKEASWRDLFADIYLRRTVVIWICWFVASFVGFGITIWLPTILRTVSALCYHCQPSMPAAPAITPRSSKSWQAVEEKYG